MMKPSRNGMLFIGGREALVLATYADGVVNGVQRYSCYFGHNGTAAQIASIIGATPTIAQAFSILAQDVSIRAADINRWLKNAIVTQYEFDALLSLYYEYGNKNNGDLLAGPMIQRICAAIYDAESGLAEALFLKCCLDGNGNQSAGLLTRRIAEQCLFLTGDYTDLGDAPIGQVSLWRGDPKTTKAEIYTVTENDLP